MKSFSQSARLLGRTIAAKAKLDPPKLRWGLDFYLLAFFDLDTERHHGEGWMKIPWSSILLYAKHYQLDDEETERFIRIIMTMDQGHIDKLEEKRKEKENKK